MERYGLPASCYYSILRQQGGIFSIPSYSAMHTPYVQTILASTNIMEFSQTRLYAPKRNRKSGIQLLRWRQCVHDGKHERRR